MARVTVEDCLEKVNNRFALVHLAAKRTRQLLDKDDPLVDAPKNKPATVALREIAAARVRPVEQTSSTRTSKRLARRRRRG